MSKLSKLVMDDAKSEESIFRHEERVGFFSNAMKLSSLLVVLAVLAKGSNLKEVMKNFEEYLPTKNLWQGNRDKY